MADYFNFRFHVAQSAWDQRSFARHWWSIAQKDSRWVPPYWPRWQGWLGHRPPPHLARMAPIHLSGEAMPRRQTSGVSANQMAFSMSTSALFEEQIAAGLILRDPRRRDGVAYVAALQFANDREALGRFLVKAQEILTPQGVEELLLPTGLSLHLGSGMLQNYFHQLPPLHASYHPPYAVELMSLSCRPFGRVILYRAEIAPAQGVDPAPVADVPGPDVPGADVPGAEAPCRLLPLEPGRLAGDLLPLLQAATESWRGVPPVDEAEASFLLDGLGPWPVVGWLALVEEEPVGFVLAQADLAPLLHSHGGGRGLWPRLWLGWRGRRFRAKGGRLLFGGVLPAFRRRGIGRALWEALLAHGRSAGWEQIRIGPIPSMLAGNSFLINRGAVEERSYLLHRYEL